MFHPATGSERMTASDQALDSLALAARAADSKGGEDLVALDVSGPLPFADVFLLVTGNSERNVVAIADAVEDVLREAGAKTCTAKDTMPGAGSCSTSATSSCTSSTARSACTTGSSGSGSTARRCRSHRCSPPATEPRGIRSPGSLDFIGGPGLV